MLFGKRNSLIAVAIVSVLLLVGLTGLASAGVTKVKTVCLDGYVINHREIAVDATKLPDGLKVEAVNSAKQSVFAKVDSAGYFKFENLPVGDYNFRMQLPESWDGLVPLAARDGIAETGMTTLDEKTGCYRIVFKIRRLFDLTVIKWAESLEGDVKPAEGWKITAAPVKDPFVQPKTETTDVGGHAQFTITPGKWMITEQIKSGWAPVTPAQVSIDLDQYAAAGAMSPVVFKNREPVCYDDIIVRKVGYGHDEKGTEVQLGPLAGWKVTVARADKSAPPITKMTDGSGTATFKDVAPGVYKVSEEVQPGWKAMSDNPQTVIHRDCEPTEVLFENKEISGELKISGYKYFKAWEWPYKGHPMVGLSSWVISATLVGTENVATATTNALGYYEFSQAQLEAADMAFPGATIEVCEVARTNWFSIGPSCVKVKFPYPVPPSYKGARVDFINAQDPPLASAPAVETTQPASGCQASYIVQRGETLAKISAMHGASASVIAKASGVANPNIIRVGQRLCIP